MNKTQDPVDHDQQCNDEGSKDGGSKVVSGGRDISRDKKIRFFKILDVKFFSIDYHVHV